MTDEVAMKFHQVRKI